MKIILDSNAIIGEQFFRSNRATAFLKALKLLDYKVFIPAIVIDEVKANFRKRLKKDIQDAEQKHQEIGKLVETDFPKLDLDSLCNEYNDYLDDLLNENEVEILDYPNIAIRDIIQKSYEGNKPFKAISGEGYKDYIIWRTILDQLNLPPGGEYYFVTNNKTDFCKEGEVFTLHDSLKAGLPDKTSLLISCSIKEIFSDDIEPELQGIDPTAIDLDINETVNEQLQELLENYHSDDGFEGSSLNDVTVSYHEHVEILGKQLSKISDDEILISIVGTVSLELTGFMDKSTFYGEYDSGEYVIDGDWNDHVVMAGKTISTSFELTMTYSVSTKAIVDKTLDFPEEINTYC